MDKIPEDTWLDIFTHARPSADPDWTKPAASVYSWITITHVCRQWREVMLAAPFMWDHLLMGESCNPTINAAAAAFLERSGETPLHLSLIVGPMSQSERGALRLDELLQQAIPRTTNLSICLRRETELEPLWSKLRISAPLLSDFFVLNTAAYTFPGHFGPIVLSPFPPDHIIPRSLLFNDQTPSLHIIRLTHIYNPLPTTIVGPGVKRLELKGYDKHDLGSVPISLLQGVAVHLTELVLLSAADYDVTYPSLSPSDPKVDFPALENLVVYGTINCIPAILNWMSFPTTTTVRIRIIYPPRGGIVYEPSAEAAQPDQDALIEALVSLFPASSPALAVIIADGHESGCRFWNYIGWNTDAPEGGPPTPRLTLINAPQRMDIPAFMCRLPLAECEVFQISSDKPVDATKFIPAVRNMERVWTCEIAGNGAVACFAQLMAEHDGRFLLPALRQVDFFWAEFASGRSNPFEVFADAVATRAERKASVLEEVWFSHCEGFKPMINSLQKVVGTVGIDRPGL